MEELSEWLRSFDQTQAQTSPPQPCLCHVQFGHLDRLHALSAVAPRESCGLRHRPRRPEHVTAEQRNAVRDDARQHGPPQREQALPSEKQPVKVETYITRN